MKKQLTLSAIVILLAIKAISQTELLTVAENNLQGKVKSISTKAYWLKEMFGEMENDRLYYTEDCAFDKDGMLTYSYKNQNSGYETDFKFKYDSKNQLIQKKEEYGRDKAKKGFTWKYVYNDKRQEIEQTLYDEKGEMWWKKKVKYLEDGRIREENYYNTNGDLYSRLAYQYNSAKQLENISSYGANEKIFKTQEFTYDDQGNKIKEKTRSGSGKDESVTTFNWTYSGNRKTSETKLSSSANKDRTAITEYDKNGNVIKLTESSGSVRTTTYTYDSYNNWITATHEWKNTGSPSTYREYREIRYY